MLEGGAFVRGTLTDPRIDALFDVKDFSIKSAQESFPVGFRFDGHYADNRAKLSLQKHFHRAEHWVVVNGTALVTRDGEALMLKENESIFLPLGCVHRLENPGRIALNLIEIQSGPYLGEDDIVRFEDLYARSQDD